MKTLWDKKIYMDNNVEESIFLNKDVKKALKDFLDNYDGDYEFNGIKEVIKRVFGKEMLE